MTERLASIYTHLVERITLVWMFLKFNSKPELVHLCRNCDIATTRMCSTRSRIVGVLLDFEKANSS